MAAAMGHKVGSGRSMAPVGSGKKGKLNITKMVSIPKGVVKRAPKGATAKT